METTNQTTVAPKTDSVDYAAALRHYSRYGRGRSMRKFCEDEGYDYWKFCRYARSEWPAMKRVLESGDVEISNNISEQTVRKLKMNLRNAGNIGSESSAADNAFMYSVIESCRLNDIDPGKYLRHLLNSLKSHRDGDDLTGLLPCYCTL